MARDDTCIISATILLSGAGNVCAAWYVCVSYASVQRRLISIGTLGVRSRRMCTFAQLCNLLVCSASYIADRLL